VGALPWPQERAIGLPPEFEIVAEFRAMVLVETGDDDFDDDQLGRRPLSREIIAAIEIVFVDRLRTRESIWANGELDGFEYRRLSSVVVAKEDGCSGKMDFCLSYAPKILDKSTSYFHNAPSSIFFVELKHISLFRRRPPAKLTSVAQLSGELFYL